MTTSNLIDTVHKHLDPELPQTLNKGPQYSICLVERTNNYFVKNKNSAVSAIKEITKFILVQLRESFVRVQVISPKFTSSTEKPNIQSVK